MQYLLNQLAPYLFLAPFISVFCGAGAAISSTVWRRKSRGSLRARTEAERWFWLMVSFIIIGLSCLALWETDQRNVDAVRTLLWNIFYDLVSA